MLKTYRITIYFVMALHNMIIFMYLLALKEHKKEFLELKRLRYCLFSLRMKIKKSGFTFTNTLEKFGLRNSKVPLNKVV